MPVPPVLRQTLHSDSQLARVIAEGAIALIGAALLASAIAANQRWLDSHFLPTFFVTRQWYVFLEDIVRVAAGMLGVSLGLLARPRVGRFVARAPASALHVLIAAAMALGASEFVLRHVQLRPSEWLWADEEPRRQADPRLGWTFVPARTGRSAIGGRVVEYAFDPAGYRVRSVGEPVDPERPTILFTGESVMFGEGLTWEESIPAQVGAMMGLQSANLAVDGFGTDQAYLRLQTELPRFRRPVAVVALFMTTLLGRNIDDDRPHLGPGLVWQPSVQHWRLVSLATRLVPYSSRAAVERGITVTREVLRATVALAAARGATPLVLDVQFGPEDSTDQWLRRRILDDGGVPYVLAEVDPAWTVPGDGHPNARAAQAIARDVVDRLRGR